MEFICTCSGQTLCWSQIGFLTIAIISMLWVLRAVVYRKVCKKCLHPSAIALRRYHTSFWNNDVEVSDLVLIALKLIKVRQGAYEVFYIQYNEDESLKLAASSEEKLDINYSNLNDTDIITPLEHSLLEECSKYDKNREEGISGKLEVDKNKIAFLFPINVDGYDIGQICIIFEEGKSPELIDSYEMINLVTGLLRYREKSGILENALGRCESDLDTMMNATPNGILILNMDMKVRRINHIAEDMVGFKIEDCQGCFVEDIIKIINGDCRIIRNLLAKSIESAAYSVNDERLTIQSKFGSEYVVRFRAAPIFGINGTQGVMLIICDVRAEEIIETERSQHKEERAKHHLELQMEQEQRREVEKALMKSGALASAGTLAAAIAHEYNNVNSIAMGNLDVLLQMKDLPEFVMDSLKTVRGMMSKGAEITKDLLDYTRNNHTNGNKRENVSLIDIVQKTKKMVDKEFIVEGIRFYSNFDNVKDKNSDQYMVFVDPSRIQQVMLNLILNARHAMVDSSNKSVTFKIGIDKGRPYLDISDTGHGIYEEDLSKLFNPYFSTKGQFAKFESQKQFTGNGLGLAICNLIMKKNGGSIGVTSKLGEGTTFTLKFDEAPLESLDIDKHEENDEDEDIEIKNGKGRRILILDDEFELCKLLEHMFSGHGYIVKHTDDGHEGLRMHKEDPFDLIITDVQMPKMTGLEFLNKLSILGEPQPKKMVMTGRITKQETGNTKFDEFIQKPFDLIRFMAIIQRLLEL